MVWTYRICAAARPRVLMRVAQLFDQQSVPMSRCCLLRREGMLEIEIIVDVDTELAQRIHAKLYKLEDLTDVELLSRA